MVAKFNIRNQLQAGLIIDRVFYGSLSLSFAVAGSSYERSIFYIPIQSVSEYSFIITMMMFISGVILISDGVVAFLSMKLDHAPIARLCAVARKVRIWCFMPAAFCYMVLSYSTFRAASYYKEWEISMIISIIFAAFGMIFSLHESMILNERNRYKDGVCKLD